MLKNIINYIGDNNFKIYITNNNINILNYKNIDYLTETKISIQSNNNKIIIEGKNLKSTKLLENEILIEGNIKSIIWSNPDE